MLRAVLLAFALTLSAVPVAAGTIDDAYAAYNSGDYKSAARLFRLLADQGNASAQYNLGLMYSNGQGVPQDYVLAHMWLNCNRPLKAALFVLVVNCHDDLNGRR